MSLDRDQVIPVAEAAFAPLKCRIESSHQMNWEFTVSKGKEAVKIFTYPNLFTNDTLMDFLDRARGELEDMGITLKQWP